MRVLHTKSRAKVLALLRAGWRLSAQDVPNSSYQRDYMAVRCMLYQLNPTGNAEVYRVDQGVVGNLAREGAIQMTASAGGVSTYTILDPPCQVTAHYAEMGALGPEGVRA